MRSAPLNLFQMERRCLCGYLFLMGKDLVEAVWGEEDGMIGMKSSTLPVREGQRLQRFLVTNTKKADLVYCKRRHSR